MIPVFDTLTHFMTQDLTRRGQPLGMSGYLAYTRTWQDSNVTAINLLAGACPVYERDGAKITPCMWAVHDGTIVERSWKMRSGKKVSAPAGMNPYREVNDLLRIWTREAAQDHPELRFYRTPLIHPRRTTIEELERVIGEDPETLLALKVHGIATASGPADMGELTGVIAHSGLPLLIHTDYASERRTGRFTEAGALGWLRRRNNPSDWLDYCLKNDIRAVLQHGARNDPAVYDQVGRYPGQFAVGLGPILQDGERMVVKTDDYVRAVFDNLEPEHVLFCSDYPFSEAGEDLTARVMELLAPEEQELVLHKNAERFFGLEPVPAGTQD